MTTNAQGSLIRARHYSTGKYIHIMAWGVSCIRVMDFRIKENVFRYARGSNLLSGLIQVLQRFGETTTRRVLSRSLTRTPGRHGLRA